MNGTYGHISKRLLGYYDRDLLSWKMYEATLDLGFPKSSLTLPLLGMMQDGDLYELAMLERPIEEKDYLSLPTPMARDYKGKSTRNIQLPNAVSLLPTPTAMHVRNHEEPVEKYQQRVLDYEEGRTKGKPGPSLGVALRLFPTPTTGEGSGQCRDYRSDMTHAAQCTCKKYRLHWIKVD
jgi:hypothetical protein